MHGTGIADRRGRLAQAAIDAFHHDDGGIDNQAEIDCTDGKEVCRFPLATRMPTAKNKANGMVVATISALRKLPRKIHCKAKINRMPNAILCRTVLVVMSMRSLRS